MLHHEEQAPYAGRQELTQYFQRYVTDVLGLSKSTARHYLEAIRKVSSYLKAKGLVKEDLFEVGSVDHLASLWEIVKADPDFQRLNKTGHNMYSAGFQHYFRFAQGDAFGTACDRVPALDVPVVAEEPTVMEHTVWKRSGILRTQSLEFAHYECALDHSHQTFIAESTHKPYMEAHHIIPMNLQGRFPNSLDVYANIICLCPICHRKIHLGLRDERREIIDRIYEERKDRLYHSGFMFGKGEFERLTLDSPTEI